MKDLIIFILIIYILFEINNLKKIKEGFNTDAAITTAVKKVYLADVEAIRLLSNFAIQLSQGGTTLPGNVTFTGAITGNSNLTIGGNINCNNYISSSKGISSQDTIVISNNIIEGGRISIRNSLKNVAGKTNDWSIWNMTGGYGDKLAFWRYNGDGTSPGAAVEFFDNGNVEIKGTLTVKAINVTG
jgi:hypothetical protein